MKSPDATCERPTKPQGPDELHHRLQDLRHHLETQGLGESIGRLIGQASAAAEKITVEHAGMAEELLTAYEQLGAVFDVTRRLPSVRNESEVVDLFVESLRRTYEGRDVVVIVPERLGRDGSPNSNGGVENEERRVDSWLGSLIQRARTQRRVLVEPAPEGALPDGMADVMVGPVFAGNSFASGIIVIRPEHVEPFRSNDMLLLESLTMFCGDLIANHRLVRELQDMSLSVVRSLVNAVDQKDQYTSGHSVRVGYFATMLGEAIGLGCPDLQMLQWGALLHDIGKIGTRDEVLNKEGKLTEDEFRHIKEHPVSSYKI
ncbi:MAG: HD domain-containing protein, partial [Phycisphaerae bacterium]